jgi:glycosyltransferase involved in cell wall biosynthesis
MCCLTLSELPPPPAGKTGWPFDRAQDGPFDRAQDGPFDRAQDGPFDGAQDGPWTEESSQSERNQASGKNLVSESTWLWVSVVTPSYNQGHLIEETIRSVLLQGYPHLEYVVIDGGSSDNTLDVLRHYEDHLRWVSEPDQGQADAINKGVRMSRGEMLAYLNSDDTYLPGSVRLVAEYFQTHPDVGMVYGDCQVIDAQGNVLGLMRGHKFNLHRLIHRAEIIPQPAAFWRRAVVEQVGLFDLTLRYSMDYDFFIRVGRAFRVAYIPQPLACFRLHSVSKTVSREERHWRETLAVSERYGMKPWMAWYWIRRLRHWGLRALPRPVQLWVRRRLGRAQDAQAWGF